MLKLGRCLAEISDLQAEKIDGIAQADGRPRLVGNGELGIEVDVEPPVVVEEFEIRDERRSGPDILQMENLAPSVVTEDDIGRISDLGEGCRSIGDRTGPDGRRLELDGFLEDVWCRSGNWFILYLTDGRDLICIWMRQEGDIMPGVGGEPTCDMQVLAREVLVDKKKAH